MSIAGATTLLLFQKLKGLFTYMSSYYFTQFLGFLISPLTLCYILRTPNYISENKLMGMADPYE